MSHISKIELKINDLDALKKACDRLALHFIHDQKSFKWYNGLHPCDHAIKAKNTAYEIGVVHQNNNYDLYWDDWSTGGLIEKIGPEAGLLKQAYTIEKILSEARLKNMRYTEVKKSNGVRVTLTV